MKVLIIEAPPEKDDWSHQHFSVLIGDEWKSIKIARPNLKVNKDFQPKLFEIEVSYLPDPGDTIKIARSGDNREFYVSAVTLVYQTYYDYEIIVFDAILHDALSSQMNEYFYKRREELQLLMDFIYPPARFSRHYFSVDYIFKELTRIAANPDFDYDEELAKFTKEKQAQRDERESPKAPKPTPNPKTGYDLSDPLPDTVGYTGKTPSLWRRFLNLYKQ